MVIISKLDKQCIFIFIIFNLLLISMIHVDDSEHDEENDERNDDDNNVRSYSKNRYTNGNDQSRNIENSAINNNMNDNRIINNGNRTKRVNTDALEDDLDPNIRDSRTGLSLQTLRQISNLPTCTQQTLTNYRRLLKKPSIRLQFYRDLYQRHQFNNLDECAEGSVRIGYRERNILMDDPYFRRHVEFMMKKQPISAAISGPIDNQTTDRVLTVHNLRQ